MMKQALRTTAILASLAATLSLAMPAVADASEAEKGAASPKLAVDQAVVDLGEVVKGQKVIHEFIIRNEGSVPLEIEDVRSSCGCTVAEFDRVVPPGGRGTIRAELNSLSLNGPGSTYIKVDSNDPENPLTALELKFNVVSLIRAFPGYARWLMTQGEKEGTIGQTIWATVGADLRVVKVEPPVPHISASFRPATEEERQEDVDGPQWRVELTLDNQAPVGAITGEVMVHLDHPQQKVLPIPISGFVRPTVFVEPQTGDFGTLHLKETKRAVYNFRNFATEPIAVTGAEPSVEGLEAEVETVEIGRRYRVILKFDPASMPEGPFQGKLVIRTDSPKVPAYEIDLKGTLVDSRDEQAESRSSAGAGTGEERAAGAA